MSRKKKSQVSIPYGHNEHIHVYYELQFNKDVIKPGDPVKIKNTRGKFKFLKMVHNSELDVTWIDCMDIKDGQFRSFYLENLKGVIRPKRSRRKKLVV